jgi:hypothetical protein
MFHCFSWPNPGKKSGRISEIFKKRQTKPRRTRRTNASIRQSVPYLPLGDFYLSGAWGIG